MTGRVARIGNVQAAAWRWAFLRHLGREVTRLLPDRSGSVIERTSASRKRLVDDHAADVPDAPGLVIIEMSALVLAGYRELVAQQVDRQEAYTAVRNAFLATWRTPTRWFVRGFLALSRDPVSRLSSRWYLRFVQVAYGATIRFEHRVSANRVDLVVTRCAFNQFFLEHGEPLLTRVVCEWDRNWISEMNASRRPIQVGRPLTISTGCDHCEFQHLRAADVASDPWDVVLDQAGPHHP